MEDSLLPSLPLLFLYAETHFRFFRGFPSFLYRRSPEILFDLPRRIRKGEKLPVMLMVHDRNAYPADIQEIKISITRNATSEIAFSTTTPSEYEIDHPFRFQSSVYLFDLDTTDYPPGEIAVNATAAVVINKRKQLIINDNTPTSSMIAYTCTIAKGRLPGANFCSYGDVHAHSQYSQSHVEFGPPISIISRFAKEYGLDFVGITDHSYDLCCKMDNYLQIDPSLSRWHNQRRHIDSLQDGFTILQGEEVSVFNGRNHVVHLGGLGIADYIPGSRDGARRNPQKNSTIRIDEAVGRIKNQGGLCFAAHPGARAGLMQRIFLRRGTWKRADIAPELDAFQIVNSGFSTSWYTGRALWIRALLDGQKLALLAGNDAHGDFNRYRATGIPFVSVHESFDRYLGFAKTGVYGKPASGAGILQSIKAGKTFVTTGPFLTICRSEDIEEVVVGDSIELSGTSGVYVIGIGGEEFGYPITLRVFRGTYDSKREVMILCDTPQNKTSRITATVSLEGPQHAGYLRAELVCEQEDQRRTMAATSPVYLKL